MTNTLVTVDARRRVALPGAASGEQFLVEELPGGAFRLEPAQVVTRAQLDYLATPELQALLTRAAQSETVHRARRRHA